jgi:hypothetical protein
VLHVVLQKVRKEDLMRKEERFDEERGVLFTIATQAPKGRNKKGGACQPPKNKKN